MPTLTTTLPGVLLKINGQGVLITGASGIGKSELALGLIKQGHRLIADDSVNISLTNEDKLLGSCSPLLQDFLNIRDLGLINIRKLFGDAAISNSCLLQLIIQLYSSTKDSSADCSLSTSIAPWSLLNSSLPTFKLNVSSGRNLVLLVETLVANFKLSYQGYHAMHEFTTRQQQILDEEIR